MIAKLNAYGFSVPVLKISQIHLSNRSILRLIILTITEMKYSLVKLKVQC